MLLLHVIDDLPARVEPSADKHSSFELLSFAESRKNERLAECVNTIGARHTNIQVETQIIFGKAFLKIEAGLQNNSDVVVIDANRGGKKQRHAGSDQTPRSAAGASVTRLYSGKQRRTAGDGHGLSHWVTGADYWQYGGKYAGRGELLRRDAETG